MKKLLLGSTALLGAIALSGAASAQQVVTKAPFTLQIGGSFSEYFGVLSGGNQNLPTNKKSYDLLNETLLDFLVSAKTDNGLTYGARLRKYFTVSGSNATFNNGNQNVAGVQDYERAFVFVQGSFGRVDVGGVNSLASFGTTSQNAVGPSVGNALGSDGGMAALFYNVQAPGAPAGTAAALIRTTTLGNDTVFAGNGGPTRRTKIGYVTPDFNGFRAGINYAPSPNNSGTIFDRNDTLSASASTTQAASRGNFRDAVQIAAEYTAKFNGVEVKPVLKYHFASALNTNPAAGSRAQEDASSLFGGLQVDYMGASVGVGYTNSFKSGLAKPLAGESLSRSSSEGLVVSAGYVTGPWAVSGFYQWVSQEGSQTNSGKDTARIFELAAGYTLAPGLQLWTAVNNYEFRDEGAAKYNGTLFLLGTTVSF